LPNNKDEPILAHAPLFPLLKKEIWVLILAEDRNNRVEDFRKISALRDGEEIKLRFMAPRKPGPFQYSLHLVSDSYAGFDQKKIVKIQVSKDMAPKPAKEDDEELLFSDEEEEEGEEEGEEDDKKKNKKNKDKKKKGNEEEEEEDEEGEGEEEDD
jgi:translocation protein SEC63